MRTVTAVDAPTTTHEDTTVVDDPASARSTRRHWVLSWLLWPAITVVLTLVSEVVAFRLWNMHLGIPLDYGSGDSLAHAMHLQQVIDNGWYFSEPRLGAPLGQHMQDWPVPDVLTLSMAWVLALFTSNWAAILNVVYLLGYPLAALSAYWVGRQLGLLAPIATFVGVLYAFLPYHVVQGEHHLFLSNYYVAPLGVLLAMRLLGGEPLFATRVRAAQTCVFALIVGFGGVYYAAFTVVFLLAATAFRLFLARSARPLASGVGVIALIALFTFSAGAPAVLYHVDHGDNPAVADREPEETEFWSLKLTQMLVPAPGHRIDVLADVQEQYVDDFPLETEGSAALGSLGAFGLLWMFGTIAVSAVGVTTRGGRVHQLSSLSFVAFLVATVGGLSSVVALLLTSRIRTWERMSVFLAFCALATVGFLVQRVIKGKRWLLIPVCGALLLVGFLDQTNSSWVPKYDATDRAFLSDQAYFREIEARLPSGMAVYQLPRMTFPESPSVEGLQSYDELKPYLHTDDLRWSFGGIKGRPASTQQERFDAVPDNELAKVLRASGYGGVLIERTGYADRARSLEFALQRTSGSFPFVDPSGNRAFYDLRPAAP